MSTFICQKGCPRFWADRDQTHRHNTFDYNMSSCSYDNQHLILLLPWSDLGHNQWEWTYPAWTPENNSKSTSSHILQSQSNAWRLCILFVHLQHLKDCIWSRFKLLLNLKELFSGGGHLRRKEAKARHRHFCWCLFWHFWQQNWLRHHHQIRH